MNFTAIKLFFSKVWKAIKQVPHWALIALLSLVAIAVSLLRRNANSSKALSIQKEISNIEKERAETISEINDLTNEEEQKLRRAYEEKLAFLREQENSLNKAEGKGPVAVASEWSDYLLKRKKK